MFALYSLRSCRFICYSSNAFFKRCRSIVEVNVIVIVVVVVNQIFPFPSIFIAIFQYFSTFPIPHFLSLLTFLPLRIVWFFSPTFPLKSRILLTFFRSPPRPPTMQNKFVSWYFLTHRIRNIKILTVPQHPENKSKIEWITRNTISTSTIR